jgi:hypothetical protein
LCESGWGTDTQVQEPGDQLQRARVPAGAIETDFRDAA